MMNPWVILALVLAWAASLGAVGYWQRTDGKAVEKAAWESRENESLVKANKSILDLTGKLRAAEFKHATLLSDISTQYQKELKDAQTKHEKDIAAIRAGSLRLYDAAACQGDSGTASGQTKPTPGGCHGGKRGQFLSKAASVFLVSEASRADQVAIQLKQCQQVIIADRSMVQ